MVARGKQAGELNTGYYGLYEKVRNDNEAPGMCLYGGSMDGLEPKNQARPISMRTLGFADINLLKTAIKLLQPRSDYQMQTLASGRGAEGRSAAMP